ncbi:unnamed protein product [Alopecurus aequalis]
MEGTWRTLKESTSSVPDGGRKVWDLIWKSDAPPKVQHFAWRLATDSLPTWRNKYKRNLEVTEQCPVCGVEAEDNFHPFFRCTLAKELWNYMYEKWNIPALDSVLHTGSDWLLNLIGNLLSRSISMVLMTLWRAWHVRNEIVHDKTPPPVESSRRFLLSYMESLLQIKYHPIENIIKGKFILDIEEMQFHRHIDQHSEQVLHWSPPPKGWCKLNTDGSFGAEGDAGAGMVVRDHSGDIILSACRQLLSCRDALQAELSAVMEGLSLALQWCNQPLIIETDCLEILKLLHTVEVDRSAYMATVEEIKSLMNVRQVCITHVKRCQNTSSHFMANLGRTTGQTAVWLASGPEGLANTCQSTCNI